MKKETSSNKISTLEADVNENVLKQSLCRAACKSISGFVKKAWCWMGARVNAHFERLIALRVYDQRRY